MQFALVISISILLMELFLPFYLILVYILHFSFKQEPFDNSSCVLKGYPV